MDDQVSRPHTDETRSPRPIIPDPMAPPLHQIEGRNGMEEWNEEWPAHRNTTNGKRSCSVP